MRSCLYRSLGNAFVGREADTGQWFLLLLLQAPRVPEVRELSLSSSDDFPFYKSGATRSVAAYGWDDDDDDSGPFKPPPPDPAAGVPWNVPADVDRIVKNGGANARELARKIVTGKSILVNPGKGPKSVESTPSSKCSKKAKIDKHVDSCKLKEPNEKHHGTPGKKG